MNEYKYKMIEDRSGEFESDLQSLIDRLDPAGKMYLSSAELDDGVLILRWNWVVPNSWSKQAKFKFMDGTEVLIENKVLDYPKLCPSLEKALWHLIYLNDTQQMPVDRPPDDILAKAEILDTCQFIDIEYEQEWVGNVPINTRDSMLYYRKIFKNYQVMDAGREYLKRHGIE